MTLEEARQIRVPGRNVTKVLYRGHVYDFGYVSQTGHCVIYEEGECNMQDATAVKPEDLEFATLSPKPPTVQEIADWIRRNAKAKNPQAFQQGAWLAVADAIEERFRENDTPEGCADQVLLISEQVYLEEPDL